MSPRKLKAEPKVVGQKKRCVGVSPTKRDNRSVVDGVHEFGKVRERGGSGFALSQVRLRPDCPPAAPRWARGASPSSNLGEKGPELLRVVSVAGGGRLAGTGFVPSGQASRAEAGEAVREGDGKLVVFRRDHPERSYALQAVHLRRGGRGAGRGYRGRSELGPSGRKGLRVLLGRRPGGEDAGL